MSGISDTEVARWALDASDWLWGTVQGAFNEKQTTSQIVVDAVVGMIPLVGDATAARDLIAVSTRLAEDPRKREETMEWVLLVVLVFALIPVLGGVIKGVGRLLMKVAKEAGEHSQAMREIIEFLNRVGHGNQLTWFKQLDFAKYQADAMAKFNALMDKFIEVFGALRDKLGWMTPSGMKNAIERWIVNFRALKAKGSQMIPKAISELNERLKLVQRSVYSGEWHTISPGSKATTREAEAHLLENAPRKVPRVRGGFPANTVADYKHVEGWPDLRKAGYVDELTEDFVHTAIPAFSGPMRNVELKPGDTIFRVLLPSKNYKASPWWTTTMPASAEEWRETLAVLDKFNVNNFYIKYTIPEGTSVKAWAGKAAEQFDSAMGQYLPGGGEQLFVEFPKHVKAEMLELPALSTGWGKTLKLFGFGGNADAAIAEVQLERLAANETRTKRAAGQ